MRTTSTLSDEPVPDGFALDPPADHGPRAVLIRILERDDRAESVTRVGAANAARELARAIQQYEDALPLLAEHVIGDGKMRALDSAFERSRSAASTLSPTPIVEFASWGVTGSSPLGPTN